MSNKISVGTVLYAVSRRSNEIYELTATKSGRKYFYVDNDNRYGYAHDTLKYTSENYSQHNVQLYRTKQEILDIRERYDLFSSVSDYFRLHNGGKLTLEQLRTIKKIIDNEQA